MQQLQAHKRIISTDGMIEVENYQKTYRKKVETTKIKQLNNNGIKKNAQKMLSKYESVSGEKCVNHPA